jgi:hypothetical protein
VALAGRTLAAPKVIIDKDTADSAALLLLLNFNFWESNLNAFNI